MATTKTLTAANSKIALAVEGLFPVPFVLEGYATDSAWASDDVAPAEVRIGVDGKKSQGFVPYLQKMTFTFQADSKSLDYFDTVLENQKAISELFRFDGTAILQGTGEKYAMTNGTLTNATPMAAGQKVLEQRTMEITFERINKAPA